MRLHSEIEVVNLVAPTGKTLGPYVEYATFCKMQSEYEEQIERMKCCGNCKHYNYCPMQTNKECQSSNNTLEYKWELAE